MVLWNSYSYSSVNPYERSKVDRRTLAALHIVKVCSKDALFALFVATIRSKKS